MFLIPKNVVAFDSSRAQLKEQYVSMVVDQFPELANVNIEDGEEVQKVVVYDDLEIRNIY